MLNRWKKKKRKGEALLEHFQFSPRRKTKGDAVVRVWRSENPPSWNWLALFCIFDYATMCVFAPHFLRRGWREPVLHSVADLPGMDTKKKTGEVGTGGNSWEILSGHPQGADLNIYENATGILCQVKIRVYIFDYKFFFFGLNRWKKKKIQLSTGERTGRVALTGVRFLEAAPAK